PDLQSPRLLRGRGWEAELRKGNAHLRGPAERVNGGLYYPNRIPGVIAPAAEAVGVHLHARRIRLEKQAADVIVIRIEDHFDVIGVHVGVAPHQPRADTARAGVVEHPGADIQSGAVERETDLGALRGDVALVRLGLAEVGGGRRGVPDRLVELAVHVN